MKHVVTLIRILFLVLFLLVLASGKMMMWFGLIAVSLFVALVFGRVYCGYVCPMNTLMTFAERISKKLGLQTASTPKWLGHGNFTWAALLISISAMLLLKQILHINLPILLIWLIISVIVTLRYKPGVFHNLICPFAGLQRSFGKYAKLSKRIDPVTCVGCGLCKKVCPSDAITVSPENRKAAIDTALCLQCTNCAQVCPKSAVYYSDILPSLK